MKKFATLFIAGVIFANIVFLNSVNAQSQAKQFKHENKTYELVEQKMNWEDAAQYAKEKGGYLLQIETQAEQQAVYHEIITSGKVQKTYTAVNDGGGIAYVWIGANDKATEGEWKWDGDNDGNGEKFWEGQGANGAGNGKTVDGSYQNWGGNKEQGVTNEPDDFMGKQDAAAFALDAWPKGAGFLGSIGEWNDIDETNALYFIIEYDYADVPAKPEILQGSTSSCVGEVVEYTCSEIENATAYEWIVNPESAASIEVNNNVASVTWNKGFNGNVSVQVVAINPLGQSDVSDEYSVVLSDVPPVPATPQGKTLVAPDKESQSTYEVAAVPEANEYLWKMEPIGAGELNYQNTTATITWNEDFEGEVLLSVSSINNCGESAYCDALAITLEPTTSVADNQIQNLGIYPNPTSDFLNIKNQIEGKYSILVYDLEGRLVKEVEAQNSKVGIEFETPGVYVLKIQQGEEFVSKKIIVE